MCEVAPECATTILINIAIIARPRLASERTLGSEDPPLSSNLLYRPTSIGRPGWVWHPRLELYSVPVLQQVRQDGVHHPLLLQHVHAAELLGADLDPVHGPATPRDITHNQLMGFELGREEVPDMRLGIVEEIGLLEARRRRGGCGRARKGGGVRAMALESSS